MSTDNIEKLPTNTPETAAAQPPGPPTLDEKTAIELSGALVRFDELRNAPIATKESDQELALLGEYIAGKLVTHARDLLSCWFLVAKEYKPLVIAMAPIVGRCVDMRRTAIAEGAQQNPAAV
jgi:hypothetical protein